MFLLIKRAVADTFLNGFLSVVTIVTMALSILVLSTFVLFFENGERLLTSWTDSIRIVAFLVPDFDAKDLPGLESSVSDIDHVSEVRFVSKDEALKQLSHEMAPDTLFLDTLGENPLPHSLEIVLDQDVRTWEAVETVAERVGRVANVADVEFGKEWRERFFNLFRLFKMAGYPMAGLFCLVALFITANTAGLALYARREEVYIMRLVGATDRFIRMPFYISGLLQGTVGGILGIGLLAGFYMMMSSGLRDSIPAYPLFGIRFISFGYCCGIVMFSSLLGFSGCYLSLKHYLK